ncbi:unnamed protein product [Blepharisma stoltei]|uniref:GRIP domain-containing protein n=1 Tax=Blepharisma stoltei TaxID=1481888 RepID=A0AAU9JG32_9CILI|nr:unnamed protein product [Blepharisma stoltei]
MRHRSLDMPAPSAANSSSLNPGKILPPSNVVTCLHEKIAGLEKKYNQFVGQCSQLMDEKPQNTSPNSFFSDEFLSTFNHLSPDRTKYDSTYYNQIGQAGIQKIFKNIVTKIEFVRERIIPLLSRRTNYKEEALELFSELKDYIWSQMFEKADMDVDSGGETHNAREVQRYQEILKSIIESKKEADEKIEELKDLLNKKKLENIKLEYKIQQFHNKIESLVDENKKLKNDFEIGDALSKTLPKSKNLSNEPVNRFRTMMSPNRKSSAEDLKFELKKIKEELQRIKEERDLLKTWKETTSKSLIQDYENEKALFQSKLDSLQKKLLGFSKVAQNLVEDSFRHEMTLTSGDWGNLQYKTQDNRSISRSRQESPMLSPLESPKASETNKGSSCSQYETIEFVQSKPFGKTTNSFIKKPERKTHLRSNKPADRRSPKITERYGDTIDDLKRTLQASNKISKEKIQDLIIKFENDIQKQMRAINSNVEDKIDLFENSFKNMHGKLQSIFDTMISYTSLNNKRKETIDSLERKLKILQSELEKHISMEELLDSKIKAKSSEILQLTTEKNDLNKKYQDLQKKYKELDENYQGIGSQIKDLENELHDKNDEVIGLNKKHKEEISIAGARVEKLLMEIYDLKDKKNELENEKNEMIKDIEKSNDMLKNIQKSIQINEQTILNLRKDAEKHKGDDAENAKLKKELDISCKKEKDLFEKIAQLKYDTENEAKTYRNELIRLNQSLDDYKAKFEDQNFKISSLSTEIENLHFINEELKDELLEAANSKNFLENKEKASKVHLENVLEEKNWLIQDLKSKDEKLQKLKLKFDDLTKEHKDLELKYANQAKEVILLNTDALRTQNDNLSLKDELNSLKEAHSKQENELESLKKSYNDNEINLKNSNKTIELLNAKILEKESAINSNNEKINILQNEISQFYEKSNQHEACINNVKEVESKLLIVSKEKDFLEKELKCLKNLNTDLTYEIEAKLLLIKDLEVKLEGTNKKYEQKSKELNDELKLNQDYLENLQDELNTYHLSYSQQQDQLKDALEAAAQLDKQKSILQKEINELKQTLLDYEKIVAENNKLSIQVEELKSEKNILEKHDDEFRRKCEEIESQKNELEKKLETEENDKNILEETIESLKNSSKVLESENSELLKSIEILKIKKEVLENENKSQQIVTNELKMKITNLQEIESEKFEMVKYLEIIEAEKEKLAKNKEIIEIQNKELTENMEFNKNTINDLYQKLSIFEEIKSNNDMLSKELQALKAEKSDLLNQISLAESKSSEKNKDLEFLRNQIIELETKETKYQEQNDRLFENLRMCEVENTELSQNILKLEGEIKDVHDELNEKKQVFDKLTEDYNEKNKIISELTEDFNEKINEKDQMINRLTEDFNEKINEKDQIISKLADDFNKKFNEKNQIISDLIDDLNKELNEKNQIISQLTDDLNKESSEKNQIISKLTEDLSKELNEKNQIISKLNEDLIKESNEKNQLISKLTEDFNKESNEKNQIISKLTEALNKSNEKNKKISKLSEDLNKEINEKTQIISKLTEDLHKESSEKNQVISKLIEDLNKESNEKNQIISKLTEDLNKESNEKNQIISKLTEDLNKESNEKNEIIKKLSEDLNDHSIAMSKLKENILESESLIEKYKSDIYNFRKDIQSLENQLKIKEDAIIKLQKDLTNEQQISKCLENEKVSLAHQKATEIAKISEDLEEEKKSNDSLCMKLIEIKEKHEITLEEKDQLSNYNKKLSKNTEKLEEKIENHERTISHQETTINELKEVIGSNKDLLKDKLVEVEARLQEAESQLEDKEKIIAQLKEEANHFDNKLKSLNGTIEDLKIENDNLDKKIDEIKRTKDEEILLNNKKFSDEKALLVSHVSGYKLKLNNLKGNLSDIAKEIKEFKEENNLMISQIIDKSDKRNKEFSNIILKKDEEIKLSKKEILEEFEKNSALNEQINQLHIKLYEGQTKSAGWSDLKENFEKSIKSLREDNENLRDINKKISNELEAWKRNYEEIYKKNVSNRDTIDKLTEENHSLQLEISNKNQKIEESSKILSSFKEESNNAKNDLEKEIERLQSLIEISLSSKPNENKDDLEDEIKYLSLDIIKSNLIAVESESDIQIIRTCIDSYIQISELLKSELSNELSTAENLKMLIKFYNENISKSPSRSPTLDTKEPYISQLKDLKTQITNLVQENKSLKAHSRKQSRDFEDPDLNPCSVPIVIAKCVKVDGIKWVLVKESDGNYIWYQENQLSLSHEVNESEEDIDEIKTALGEYYQGSILKSIYVLKQQSSPPKKTEAKESQTECIFGDVFGEISHIKDTPFVSVDFENEFEIYLTSEVESESNSSNLKSDLEKIKHELEKKTIKYLEKKRRLKLNQEQIDILKQQIRENDAKIKQLEQIRENDAKIKQLESIDLNYLKNLFSELIKGTPPLANDVERIVKIFYKILNFSQSEEDNIQNERKNKRPKNIISLFR